MREDGGYEVIKAAIDKLGKKHKEHIAAYGEGNERRLTGRHETADINTFLWVRNKNKNDQTHTMFLWTNFNLTHFFHVRPNIMDPLYLNKNFRGPFEKIFLFFVCFHFNFQNCYFLLIAPWLVTLRLELNRNFLK